MSPLNYQFGEFTLDVAKGCVFKGKDEIKLRPKVYDALRYLVANHGRLVSKQELMQAVWPDAFVTDDSLVQCTLELRKALGDRDQQLLKTVPRRGYIFTASVVPLPDVPVVSPEPDSFVLSDRRGLSAEKADRKQNDLPVPRTSFVGREQQLAEASDLLLCPDVRLLSLTGPGGAGKTRLSIAVAAALKDRFSAGVRFVSLASITHPDLVATAVATALDIQEVANRTIAQRIGGMLNDSGPFLLVLDNFEQVLPAATFVAEILEACPSLKVLVTSRSSLRIYGEQEFPLAPLAQNSAIELFAQRAAAVWPDFAVNAENELAIREICSRLDGLPLAIELAAARTKVLSPDSILDRLQSPLRLLTGGARDLPERQQTLRKTIDWSHGLLNETEQKLFRRLSVFVGGCTLEAAEAACDTRRDLGMDLFQGLSSLVDKNLVHRMERNHGEPRFAMLETIREYAIERLVASGEQADTRRAHAAFCLVLAEEGNPELNSPDRTRWLTQCDAEIDNFRHALDWLVERGDLEWGFRLSVALFRFWDMREHLTEGRVRLENILRLAGDQRPRDRARVLHFLGALTTSQGDYQDAENYLEKSLALYEELGDDSGIAASLNALGIAARDRGDYASAQRSLERSLASWRMLSDHLAIARCLHNLANVSKARGDYSRARWALDEAAKLFDQIGDRSGAAWSLNQQGDIARAMGHLPDARVLYQRALATFRQSNDSWGIARSLTDLAYIDCEQGDSAAARTAYFEALQIFSGLGHRRGIARALEGCAFLALTQGQAARALTLIAAATRLRRQIGAPLSLSEQSKLTLEPAYASLSEADAHLARARGSEMSLEQAIQYSMEES